MGMGYKFIKQNTEIINVVRHIHVCNFNSHCLVYMILLTIFTDIPADLFQRKATAYSEEQRKFAMTLHLYSPKAYEFLRQHLPLPAPRSLRRYTIL